MMNGFLVEISILCLSAVLLVPLFRRISLGPSIAYIFAGSLIGPFAFDLIKGQQSIELGSELGVVFLLFIIGLSITPKKLKSLKVSILLLGPLQVILTSVIIFFILDLEPIVSLLVSVGLSLSSTALGLTFLENNNLMGTKAAINPLGVLVFQDILVVPILIAVGYLSKSGGVNFSFAFCAIFMFLSLKYLLTFDSVVNYITHDDSPEVFTAFCLLAIFGLSYVSKMAFGTTSIGALTAGVLLASSIHKENLQQSIGPFKSLLLGLFFMLVGMKLNYSVLIESWPTVIVGLLLLVSIKIVINYLLFAKLTKDKFAFRNSLLIGQSGEFGFIIFGLATHLELLSIELNSILSLVIGLSMVLTSILVVQSSKVQKTDKPAANL